MLPLRTWSGDSFCVSPNTDFSHILRKVQYFRVTCFDSFHLVAHGRLMARLLIALDQYEPTKIRSTEKGSILREISTQSSSPSGPVSWASQLKACSFHFHSVESSPSSVTTIVGTTLFIDRRPQNLTQPPTPGFFGRYSLNYWGLRQYFLNVPNSIERKYVLGQSPFRFF